MLSLLKCISQFCHIVDNLWKTTRKLMWEQILQLESLRIGDEELVSVYDLAQDFRAMGVARQAEALSSYAPCQVFRISKRASEPLDHRK